MVARWRSSRNLEAGAWLEWDDEPAERSTPADVLRESLTTDPPDAIGVVVMHMRNEFPAEDDRLEFDQQLQFRSHSRIIQDLA